MPECGTETSQNGQLKGRIKSEHAQISQPQDLCASWSLSMNQLDSQYVSVKQHCPSPVLPQPKHLQVPQPLQFNQYPPPMLASPVPGDFANQYPMPTMTQFHTGQGCHQSITSGYELAPKRVMMTPREKIEKLRKRQQMRAMLAIQRQQQQFGNQVLATMEGGNIEVEDNLCTIPLADPHSPLEQNDSNTFVIAAEDHSMEQSVLNRLQDIISKLDMRIRLCIRDSLFRLAQSAAQRHHKNSTNKGSNESISNQEEINSNNSHYRIGRLPNVETETNPIDRIVAHFLFHQPVELSTKAAAEMSESQHSDKLNNESKATCSTSLPRRSHESHLVLSHCIKFLALILKGSNSKTAHAGGQGDILSGSVAVFLCWARQRDCQGESSINPTILGCVAGSALLRKAASIAFEDKRRSTLTGDIIECLGRSLEEMYPFPW